MVKQTRDPGTEKEQLLPTGAREGPTSVPGSQAAAQNIYRQQKGGKLLFMEPEEQVISIILYTA